MVKRKQLNEKTIDAVRLNRDIPDSFRETVPNEMSDHQSHNVNWSAAEDRGEDLASMRDPFMQQPERDTEIPPELIQERAYKLYEQRGGRDGDDLTDWFEAERQLKRPQGDFR
jgi:hypothetical protein